MAGAQAAVPGTRTVPTAGHVRPGAHHRRRRAGDLGPRRPVCCARPRAGRRRADPGPALPTIRPAADRRRPGGTGPAMAAGDAHGLGPVAARRR
ncbi:hypothetical protein G6F59_017490 [Rhizopus arrhizus]|nr:hypothetical protein G6F59_017490 [Rhizopus arrhizus]